MYYADMTWRNDKHRIKADTGYRAKRTWASVSSVDGPVAP